MLPLTIEPPKNETTSAVTEQPNATRPVVIGLAGWSGSGKTSLALRLIALLRARGLRVATLKHAHHQFDVDVPGKDSYRHREAGAEQVIVASHQRIALMIEDPLPDPADRRPLRDLLALVQNVDVVIVEGFKTEAHPKIEVYRPETGKGRLPDSSPNIVALASPGAGLKDPDPGRLALDLDRPEDWLDAVLAACAAAGAAANPPWP